MRWGKLFLMAALLAIIGGALSYTSPKERDPRVFPELTSANLLALKLLEGEKSVTIAKGGTGWGISGLSDAVLNRERLSEALHLIANLTFENELSELPDDLTPFGITDRSLMVSITWRGGQPGIERSSHLVFGEKNPFSQRRYVLMKDAGRVGLANEVLFSSLSADMNFWRSKNPFLFRVEDLLGAAVTGEREFQVERRGAGWLLTRSDGAFAGDADRIEEALRTFSRLEISGFVDAPSERLVQLFESSRAALTLTFNVRGGVVRKLTLATEGVGDGRRVYLRFSDRPTIYQLAGGMVPEIFRGDFRLSMPLYLEPYEGIRAICTPRGAVFSDPSGTGLCNNPGQQSLFTEAREPLRAVYSLAVLSYLDAEPKDFTPEWVVEIHSTLGVSSVQFGQSLPGAGKTPPRYARFTGSDGRKSFGVINGADAIQLIKKLTRE